jgi:hypothetical protein
VSQGRYSCIERDAAGAQTLSSFDRLIELDGKRHHARQVLRLQAGTEAFVPGATPSTRRSMTAAAERSIVIADRKYIKCYISGLMAAARAQLKMF